MGKFIQLPVLLGPGVGDKITGITALPAASPINQPFYTDAIKNISGVLNQVNQSIIAVDNSNSNLWDNYLIALSPSLVSVRINA